VDVSYHVAYKEHVQMGGWCLLFTNITSVCFFIDMEEEEEMTPPPAPQPQMGMVLSLISIYDDKNNC